VAHGEGIPSQAAERADSVEVDIGNPPPWATVVTTEHRWPHNKGAGTRAA
jgi:hypothetical protein